MTSICLGLNVLMPQLMTKQSTQLQLFLSNELFITTEMLFLPSQIWNLPMKTWVKLYFYNLSETLPWEAVC